MIKQSFSHVLLGSQTIFISKFIEVGTVVSVIKRNKFTFVFILFIYGLPTDVTANHDLYLVSLEYTIRHT